MAKHFIQAFILLTCDKMPSRHLFECCHWKKGQVFDLGRTLAWSEQTQRHASEGKKQFKWVKSHIRHWTWTRKSLTGNIDVPFTEKITIKVLPGQGCGSVIPQTLCVYLLTLHVHLFRLQQPFPKILSVVCLKGLTLPSATKPGSLLRTTALWTRWY